MADASPLLLAVDESDSTLRLRLTGEFDKAGVGAVEKALGRLSEAHAPRRVVFDLRGLGFLGVAGLRTILRTDARGRRLRSRSWSYDHGGEPTASSRSRARASGSASSMS